jgi:hypothetical protein
MQSLPDWCSAVSHRQSFGAIGAMAFSSFIDAEAALRAKLACTSPAVDWSAST